MYRAIAHVVLILVLAAISPLSSSAQSASDAFPLAAGTYWIFEGTIRLQDGDEHVRAKTVVRFRGSQKLGAYDLFTLRGHLPGIPGTDE